MRTFSLCILSFSLTFTSKIKSKKKLCCDNMQNYARHWRVIHTVFYETRLSGAIVNVVGKKPAFAACKKDCCQKGLWSKQQLIFKVKGTSFLLEFTLHTVFTLALSWKHYYASQSCWQGCRFFSQLNCLMISFHYNLSLTSASETQSSSTETWEG